MKYVNGQDSYLEQLSAMADGELGGAQAQALVNASRSDAQLLETWASYHAIGDALRAHASDAHVTTRRAKSETRIASAAQRSLELAVAVPSVVPQTTALQAAANDSVWRWKLVAGVAALAAVGSVLWSVVGQQGGPAGAQLAQRGSTAPAIVAAAQEVAVQGGTVQTATNLAATNLAATNLEMAPVMIRDPRLDELLAAHKQFGGASALQQPAGFLRNATFTPTGR